MCAAQLFCLHRSDWTQQEVTDVQIFGSRASSGGSACVTTMHVLILYCECLVRNDINQHEAAELQVRVEDLLLI